MWVRVPPTLPIKMKPQLYINTNGYKPKVIVIVEDNAIKEIVKESCPEIEVEIFDYDVKEIDKHGKNIRKDGMGKTYKVIRFD